MIEDRTIWIVQLSDGTEINSEQMSWQELKNKIENPPNSCIVRILRMQLRFRDHSVNMPDNADGYYFSKACGGSLGGSSLNFYIAGVLNDDMIERVWFYIPELEVHQKDVKKLDKIPVDCLIVNKIGSIYQEIP